MRVELARCSGELSPAARAAAQGAPLPALTSDTRPDAAPAPAASVGRVSDTLDAPNKGTGVPATLPPSDDAGAGRRATGTQAAAPPIVAW